MDSNLQVREDIASFVDMRLRLAFESTEAVLEGAQDLFQADEGYPGDAFVESTVQETLAALMREQETWERPTDAERLGQAFEDLEEIGILARHCYAPTRTWAANDLNEEAAIAQSQGIPVRGRVFYTSQDAEGLIDGQLDLAWGIYTQPGRTFAQNLMAADELAEVVLSVLRAAGLNASWDGAGSTTIHLSDIVWRHPRNPETGRPTLSTEPRYEGSAVDSEPRTTESPDSQLAHPVTEDGEWLIRIAYLSNTSDNGPFANLWHIHRRTNPEVSTNIRLDDFSPEATFAFDFLPLALRPLADRFTRFDLVAPPTSPFYPGARDDFVSRVDGVVFVPTDVESLMDMMDRFNDRFGDRNLPILIQLDVDTWSEASMEQVEQRFGDNVLRADLRTGDGVLDVLKAMAKLTLTNLRRVVEPNHSPM